MDLARAGDRGQGEVESPKETRRIHARSLPNALGQRKLQEERSADFTLERVTSPAPHPGKGFEHARLYEPSNLQNIANAAAIWQLASVVVAQKHLADISATLKRVESKVDSIQSFLEEERLAVIKSAINYLEVARKAVENGEFLERTRAELERFDIELIAQACHSSNRQNASQELNLNVTLSVVKANTQVRLPSTNALAV